MEEAACRSCCDSPPRSAQTGVRQLLACEQHRIRSDVAALLRLPRRYRASNNLREARRLAARWHLPRPDNVSRLRVRQRRTTGHACAADAEATGVRARARDSGAHLASRRPAEFGAARSPRRCACHQRTLEDERFPRTYLCQPLRRRVVSRCRYLGHREVRLRACRPSDVVAHARRALVLTLLQTELHSDSHDDRRRSPVQLCRRVFPLFNRAQRGLLEKWMRAQHTCLLDLTVRPDDRFDDHTPSSWVRRVSTG